MKATSFETGFPTAGPAWLFAPADRPERFDKAHAAADVVILDLEDGCQEEHRTAARENIVRADLPMDSTVIRINSTGSEHSAADLAAIKQTSFRTIMLPKTESPADIDAVVEEIADAVVIALIETPRGVLAAESIALHPKVVGLFWGAEDLTAGLGGRESRNESGDYRAPAQFARMSVLFAAGAAGIGCLDSINADISDLELVEREAREVAAAGFAGKCCIHPRQVAAIRKAFAPTEEELSWARGVVSAAKENSGAFSYHGSMIDAPLVHQARRMLALESRDNPDRR